MELQAWNKKLWRLRLSIPRTSADHCTVAPKPLMDER